MLKKKLLTGILAASLVATAIPGNLVNAPSAKADSSEAPKEITIDKTVCSNPIGGYDTDGNLIYGGDPAVLVDGDTVYLYTGHDTAQKEGYEILEWMVYSTKDLQNWNYEGVVMKADKASITWANTGTDAWAGQVEKYNGKYYFYYCTWDRTSSGKQSIGVAVSDSATGPFKDIGEPLVKGTVTTPQTSDWNDIDPTVWVETDEDGVEHRYLAWGNGKYYICELNEDMISVKDLNGDGKITSGTSTEKADIIEQSPVSSGYTEAPWLYRRKDADGNPTGLYYLFYAYNWREEMAYSTTTDLMNGKWTFGGQLMPPAATSNTNHMSVFDFKGKTYFVYHNGSLPGGSGFRRNACIAEIQFNDDGSIQPIPETATGISDSVPYTICSNNGTLISHENFVNSSGDGDYPYTDIEVGAYTDPKTEDTEWAIVAGKSIPDGTGVNKDAYVSIQSQNKPGLYLTANDNSTVTLAQDYKYNVVSGKIVADEDTAKAQTFRTVEGLNDKKAVSFESVSKPGYYLSLSGGSLVLTDGSDKAAATFYLNEEPASSTTPGTGTETGISSLKIEGNAVTADGTAYKMNVPFETTVVKAQFTLKDADAYAMIGGKKTLSTDTLYIPLNGKETTTTLTVYASDSKTKKEYTITISKNAPTSSVPVYNTGLIKTFTFENSTDNAVAVTKAATPATVSDPSYEYVDGVNGKAIKLNGSYGLKLSDAAGIGSTYSISYWMKPDKINGTYDPTLTAGTFSPEYWLNLTFSGVIWSKNGNYIDTTTTGSYKENEWQHVTLTVDGSKAGNASNTSSAKLYINGVLVCQGDIASDIMGKSGAAIYFGVNAWDAYYTGALDEVAIFNRVLSADEVQSIAYQATDVSTIEKTKDPSTSQNSTPAPSSPSPSPSPSPSAPSQKATVSKVTVKAANQKPGTKTVYLKKGGKVTLAATVTGTGSFSKAVTWKSSKTKVATVTSKGVVKAKKAGTAKITATSKADKTKKATITIKVSKKAKANKKLVLKAKKKSLKKGKTYTVAIKSMTKKTTDAVTYKTSKKAVATVDKYGVVTAKKKGTATITVKCGKKKAKLKITVK